MSGPRRTKCHLHMQYHGTSPTTYKEQKFHNLKLFRAKHYTLYIEGDNEILVDPALFASFLTYMYPI
jgi:hypothetical protein